MQNRYARFSAATPNQNAKQRWETSVRCSMIVYRYPFIGELIELLIENKNKYVGMMIERRSLMSKWCLNYDSGEYEDIDKDGYSWTRGEYVYNWDDSEYRREEMEDKEKKRKRREDDEDD